MNHSPIHSLDGRLLRLFLEVYDHNSVSRAAVRLDLTQSTVSHGVERLRRALGDPLFIKDGRNITATAHADYLAPRIREALASLEALCEPAMHNPAEDRQPVTIAANGQELQQELAGLYRRLRSEAPQLPLRILPLGAASNLRELIDSGSADIALAVRYDQHPITHESQPLLTDRMMVFYDPAGRGPIRNIDDYLAAPHIALDFGGGRPSILDQRLAERKLSRRVMVHASDLRLLAELMRGTELVATMQARFAHGVLAGLAVCEPPIELPPVHYELVWHNRHNLSRRHEWLRDHILSAISR